jgi:hypothetical protein
MDFDASAVVALHEIIEFFIQALYTVLLGLELRSKLLPEQSKHAFVGRRSGYHVVFSLNLICITIQSGKKFKLSAILR